MAMAIVFLEKLGPFPSSLLVSMDEAVRVLSPLRSVDQSSEAGESPAVFGRPRIHNIDLLSISGVLGSFAPSFIFFPLLWKEILIFI